MGNKTEDTKTLIDFLYKDTELIASLYAQIFAGNINLINKSQSELDERNTDLGGGIAGIASLKAQSKTSNTDVLQQSIDPHDYKILQLLEELNLDIYTDMSDIRQDQLVIIKGNLLIRDMETIKTLLSTKEILDIIPGINTKNNQMMNMIKGFSLFLPTGIEFELLTYDNQDITGSLKEKYLTISVDDFTRLYGGVYPAECNILCIVDKVQRQHRVQSKSSFKQGIDSISQGVFDLYNENGKSERYVIKPIVIYRHLVL